MGLIVAIVVTFVLGFGVGKLTDLATDKLKPSAPSGVGSEIWKEIVFRESAGFWVGLIERYIYLAAFWSGEYVLAAGWLAFKVAAKWESWRNLVQVPTEIEGVSELEYLRARSAWSSWILSRFLVGTGANILIGITAAGIGSLV